MHNYPKVYPASRASIKERVLMWRELKLKGAIFVASWINIDVLDITYTQLWENILQEIKKADKLVLYVEKTDLPLKGAFVEAGIAIALGKKVVIVCPDIDINPIDFNPIGSWASHPLVSFTKNLHNAVFEF